MNAGVAQFNPALRSWRWLPTLPLLVLWWLLVDHLRLEWAINPQYAYGWAVPFLCLFLIGRRLTEQTQPKETLSEGNSGSPAADVGQLVPRRSLWLACALTVGVLPTRLILEACSDWRTLSWCLALEVVGLTLIGVYWMGGGNWLKRLAFPVCFFLVAVPWLSGVEGPVIRTLTELNAATTVEALNLLGQPALRHGNVIEVSTGMVGVDEACAGIRSLQATLMISLFFGELYGLRLGRRIGLCLAGFALALVFNLGRTLLLSWIAASRGVDAIAQWHDPAGVPILLACFVSLWGIATLQSRPQLGRPSPAALAVRSKQDAAAASDVPGSFALPRGASTKFLQKTAWILAAWIILVEAGVYGWYRPGSARTPETVPWTVQLPRDKPGFRDIAMSEATWRFLRYDEALNAAWTESDGTGFQLIFLRWHPGRMARYAARSHTPEICLAAAGNAPMAEPELLQLEVKDVVMPFKAYRISVQGRPTFVYYCLWADGLLNPVVQDDTYRNRFAGVLGRVKDQGQCSLEIVVHGAQDAATAEKLLREQLEQILRFEKPGAKE